MGGRVHLGRDFVFNPPNVAWNDQLWNPIHNWRECRASNPAELAAKAS